MMKRLSIVLGATLAALSGTAAAQEPSVALGRLEVVGEAPNACVIRGTGASTASNAVYSSTGASSGQIRIVEMVDTNARNRAANVDLALEVVCNSPHSLVLRSLNGGLLRAGASAAAPGQGGFAERLPYQVSANWLGRDLTGRSDALGPLTVETRGGGAGQLSLNIAIAPGQPLLAGTYRDSIVVEFRAAS